MIDWKNSALSSQELDKLSNTDFIDYLDENLAWYNFLEYGEFVPGFNKFLTDLNLAFDTDGPEYIDENLYSYSYMLCSPGGENYAPVDLYYEADSKKVIDYVINYDLILEYFPTYKYPWDRDK